MGPPAPGPRGPAGAQGPAPALLSPQVRLRGALLGHQGQAVQLPLRLPQVPALQLRPGAAAGQRRAGRPRGPAARHQLRRRRPAMRAAAAGAGAMPRPPRFREREKRASRSRPAPEGPSLARALGGPRRGARRLRGWFCGFRVSLPLCSPCSCPTPGSLATPGRPRRRRAATPKPPHLPAAPLDRPSRRHRPLRRPRGRAARAAPERGENGALLFKDVLPLVCVSDS